MIASENLEEINDILQELGNTHLLSGRIHQKVNACKALLNLKDDETEAIYNLMETHSPSLRNKTVLRYEKLLADKSNSFQNKDQLELIKEHLATKCSTYPKEKRVEEMLNKIEEMPKEWTVVQLTPQYNPQEIWNENNDTYFTNSIHISVFNCGKREKPFVVMANAPRDVVNGEIIELSKEMISIIKLNKDVLKGIKGERFKSYFEKRDYLDRRNEVEDRLSLLIKDIQNLWLKEWRCLLTGKFQDEKLEKYIKLKIKKLIKTQIPDLELTQKVETILCCAIKTFRHLNWRELKNIIKYCFPNADKNSLQSIGDFVRNMAQTENVNLKRLPVILILHDTLDCFPWEMMDVLETEPVCRLPSLHFLYCLFKEHETDIIDGYKVIKEYNKGSYVVNPTKDLSAMETRMMTFFNYWTPNWIGTSGVEPTKDEFFELLTTSTILSYNGHGCGSTYIPMHKIEKSVVKAVVFLFGCSSTRIIRTDPQTDMFSRYDMYLIARCPCVVGMLWDVTDQVTDTLSTDFMSYWIPSNASKHWLYVDKQKWKKGEEKVHFLKKQPFEEPMWEPDLLLALLLAKQNLPNFMIKAACVVRGLPVKIKK